VKSRLEALSPRALFALGVGAVLLYSLVVWFLVVAPKPTGREPAVSRAAGPGPPPPLAGGPRPAGSRRSAIASVAAIDHSSSTGDF